MTPKDIVVKFANALEQFEPIDSQKSDTDLTRIQEVLAMLLLQIPHDETEVTHKLIGLIRPVAAYTTCYGAEFTKPARVGAYDATIDDDSTVVIRARTEAAHKAKCADRGTYETAWRETVQFVLAGIKDMWVRELRDP